MAKSKKKVKTNAVRILDGASIPYELIAYDVEDGLLDGRSVAEKTGQPSHIVFKTLVAMASATEKFVYLIPVESELDLKKAAHAAQVKKIDMLPVKELTKETGYVRGGCSAIGMKKKFPTFIDQSAQLLEAIIVSAGKPGLQMKLHPHALATITDAMFCDIVKN